MPIQPPEYMPTTVRIQNEQDKPLWHRPTWVRPSGVCGPSTTTHNSCADAVAVRGVTLPVATRPYVSERAGLPTLKTTRTVAYELGASTRATSVAATAAAFVSAVMRSGSGTHFRLGKRRRKTF